MPGPEAPPPVPDNALPSSRLRSAGAAARSIRLLAGLVGFLVVLIGVVVAAHHMRPLLRGPSSTDADDSLPAQIERLTASADRQTRLDAARAIVHRGPDALTDALAIIASVSGDGNTLSLSAPALRSVALIGEDAVPPLVRALGHRRVEVRAAAAAVLREMGPEAEDAAEALAGAVDDENRWVRWYACESLGGLGPAGAGAIPDLTRLLEHADRLTRRRAATALGQIGPPAVSAAETLRSVEQDDVDRDVRRAATLALYQISLERIAREAAAGAEPEIAELIEALGAGDADRRVAAARRLGQLGRRAEPAVPALALALRSDSNWVREAAASALGAMPRAAKNVAPSLRAATDDSDIEVRIAARRTLERVEARR